jgi:hypothetical protein
VATDEPYLLAAARYVELNPVRARLAERAGDWRRSSARAHLDGRDDALVRVVPPLAPAPDWAVCRRRVARRVRRGSARPSLCALDTKRSADAPALVAFQASSADFIAAQMAAMGASRTEKRDILSGEAADVSTGDLHNFGA